MDKDTENYIKAVKSEVADQTILDPVLDALVFGEEE